MAAPHPSMATLREVVETLAPLQRRAGSPEEEQAARWLAERLAAAGARDVRVDAVEFRDGYATLLAKLSAAGVAAGIAGLAGGRAGRRVATAVGALAAAAIADDVSNGARPARRLLERSATTWNVTAEVGDPDAERTLVVMSHHDAAPTGFVFDDTLQHVLGERGPGLIERKDTSLPLWWPVVGGPALVALGAARRSRALGVAGLALSAGSVATIGDIARSPVVPGANDNLSACACVVALAERLAAEPVAGLRVLLCSHGAEEVLQGGIYAWGREWFPKLPRESTWFLNLDTVGSPRLALLEAEGPVVMEEYPDRRWRDHIAHVAAGADVRLRRGLRGRTSTDAVVPMRAGYAIATLISIDRDKALANYHKHSDTPENLSWDTVADALRVAEAVARDLARTA